MTKSLHQNRVLISGAGIAGLTCAIALARHGCDVTVVDIASEARAGGFLVSLSHRAYHYAEKLGLIDQLENVSVGITDSSYHDRTGRTLLELHYGKLFTHVDVVQMMRDEFASVLFNEAHNLANIRFNESIEEIFESPEKVDVTFQNGITETYDAVIGADGVHSNVRQLVFENGSHIKHHLDLNCAAFRLPNILSLNDKFETHMERDRYMAVFTTGDGDLGSVFVWDSTDRTVPEPSRRESTLKAAFRDSSPSTLRVLEHCPTDQLFYFDVLAQIAMEKWFTKRVILIGDAAHCLTLFSGRGAAAAFTDACRLSELMAQMPFTDAFAAFDSETRPRLSKIQDQTKSAVKWYVPRSDLIESIRNNAMRIAPNALFRTYFRLKYSNV